MSHLNAASNVAGSTCATPKKRFGEVADPDRRLPTACDTANLANHCPLCLVELRVIEMEWIHSHYRARVAAGETHVACERGETEPCRTLREPIRTLTIMVRSCTPLHEQGPCAPARLLTSPAICGAFRSPPNSRERERVGGKSYLAARFRRRAVPPVPAGAPISPRS